MNIKRLLNAAELEDSPVVANCCMNRERDLHGSNGYEVEVGFNPLEWLQGRLARQSTVRWLDLCCGTGKALIQAEEACKDLGTYNLLRYARQANRTSSMPADLIFDVLYERHYAFSWLASSDNWDAVDMDTNDCFYRNWNRIQSMTTQPRHVICLLGQWDGFSSVQSIVDSVSPEFTLDLEYSRLEPDKRMKDAFKASLDLNNPTIHGAEWSTIDSHSAVAYVLSPPMKSAESESISATALLLVAELLNNGGVAAKSESAGLAHGRDRWLELASQYRKATKDGDAHAASAALYRAWVQRSIHDEDTNSLYSVGMHLLGHRDVEVNADLEVADAVNWIDLMGLYLVADKPKRALRNGEGFRLSHSGPRRIIELDDCDRYAEDDFYFNPYGYVRLVEDS